MSTFQLNSFDSDDDDSDYVPSDYEEAINQDMETLSNTKLLENADENYSQPSAVDKKARVDTLWKQFLKNGSDDFQQEIKNSESKLTVASVSLQHQTPKLELTSDEVHSKPSTSKRTLRPSTDKVENLESVHHQTERLETTFDEVPCNPRSSKQTLRTSTDELKNSKSELSDCYRNKDESPIKSHVSSTKKRSMGLNSLLGKIQNKKPKITTLQKSLNDWESFKKDEGIGSDLEIFNRGKNGYLERQAFLVRSDLRSFEVERSIRLARK